MNFFPVKNYEIELDLPLKSTLETLTDNTLKSTSLASDWTDKTFIGMVTNNGFRIISSKVGIGAFCILESSFANKNGEMTASIHPVFKGLVIAMIIMPLLTTGFALYLNGFSNIYEFKSILILFPIMIVIVRFVFIQLVFWYASKDIINRLFYTVKIKKLYELLED